jgi:hypothetical protein
VTTGKAFTVTTTASVSWQPLPSVTSNVYVVVVFGLATGDEIDALLRSVTGNQLYVPPPDPFNVVLSPLQKATSAPATATGNVFTVTSTLSVLTHPFASVSVSVYVVVAEGFATGLVQLVHERPAAFDHTIVPVPVPVNVVLSPLQIATSDPARTEGRGFTITATESSGLVHPATVTET